MRASAIIIALAAATAAGACSADLNDLAKDDKSSSSATGGSPGSGGGVCFDPVESSDCPPGSKCGLDCAQRRLSCMNAGAGSLRSSCRSETDCGRGLTCYSGACTRWCNGTCPFGTACTGALGCPGDSAARAKYCR
jgi:hypothetical protein